MDYTGGIKKALRTSFKEKIKTFYEEERYQFVGDYKNYLKLK